MAKLRYCEYKPRPAAQRLIVLSNEILEQYVKDGYTLTLRQLYYQLVSRDEIPNSQKSYSNLGNIISKARDAGYIDWDHIEDRTRTVRSYPHWSGRAGFVRAVVPQFRLDLWEGQPQRVFVFVEKEALAQVVARPAQRWDCPFFPNKGYLSSSAAWRVAHEMMLNQGECRDFVVLHLGDHDPSGIDMTRDIEDRLSNYARPQKDQDPVRIEVRRLALNMDQVEEFGPPPNPAKVTDSRFESYMRKYGTESWELDALQPNVIDELINNEIRKIVNIDMFDERKEQQNQIRKEMLDSIE